MSYYDIFSLGWGLNGAMFFINFILAIQTMKTQDPVSLYKQSEILSELKKEFDKFYPNRSYETLISYFIPFVAFYRVGWRLVEMTMFFNKNENAQMFDFMVYKFQTDIQKAKN
jgi:hypothetical protein